MSSWVSFRNREGWKDGLDRDNWANSERDCEDCHRESVEPHEGVEVPKRMIVE